MFHPTLYGNLIYVEWFVPEFIHLVNMAKYGSDQEFWKCMHEETFEVYSFQVFSPLFLKWMTEELHHLYHSSDVKINRPNSMNNYGIILNEVGMLDWLTTFQRDCLAPVCARLFPVEGSQFDSHHSFIVRYRADEDRSLDMHTDDSDVTFNACIGHQFTGSTLSFCGTVGTPDHRKFSHTYKHALGRAVVHKGTRRHGADSLLSGVRQNIIIWNRNKTFQKDKRYAMESGEPDVICVSDTHDLDHDEYKAQTGKHQPKRWCPPYKKKRD